MDEAKAKKVFFTSPQHTKNTASERRKLSPDIKTFSCTLQLLFFRPSNAVHTKPTQVSVDESSHSCNRAIRGFSVIAGIAKKKEGEIFPRLIQYSRQKHLNIHPWRDAVWVLKLKIMKSHAVKRSKSFLFLFDIALASLLLRWIHLDCKLIKTFIAVHFESCGG